MNTRDKSHANHRHIKKPKNKTGKINLFAWDDLSTNRPSATSYNRVVKKPKKKSHPAYLKPTAKNVRINTTRYSK